MSSRAVVSSAFLADALALSFATLVESVGEKTLVPDMLTAFWILAFPLLALSLLAGAGSYGMRPRSDVLGRFGTNAGAIAAAAVMTTGLAVLVGGGVKHHATEGIRVWLFATVFVTAMHAGQRPWTMTRAAAGRRRSWLAKLMLVLADAFSLLLAYFTAERAFGVAATTEGITATGRLFVLIVPLWIAVMSMAGLYSADDRLIHHTTLDETPRLFAAATIGTWAFLVLGWTVSSPTPQPRQLIAFWVLTAFLFPTMRAVARFELKRDPAFHQSTVIVGAGDVGQLLAHKILAHPEYRLRLIGFVDTAPTELRPDLDGLRVLGSRADLCDLVDRVGVERVIIAFSDGSYEETLDLIRRLREHSVRIDVVPRLFEVLPPQLTSETVEGIPLLTLPNGRISGLSQVAKRSVDLVVSSAALLILSPLFAAVAVLIKLDSRGPVFFRQVRIGAREQPFRLWKFRTMVADADERKDEVAHLNKHRSGGGDPRMFKIVRDPRVTRVGRFLRRYSLDELPQLLNVAAGSMSLVGPRPLIPEEDGEIYEWARKRSQVKPGITGLWQVLGRSAIPFEEMVKLDYLYATAWSPATDLKLVLQTIPVAVRGERDHAY